MPELQALYEEMQDQDVNVVGIVADGMNHEVSALQIVQKQGVTYPNIVPDQKFMDDFVDIMSVVPVALLVNSKGEILGNQIVGSRTRAEFTEKIEKHLLDMEGADDEESSKSSN